MKLLKKIKNEYLEILPPAVFFFFAFTLILITKKLILSEYGISWTGFGTAFIGAFMTGKVVLIVDNLPFANRFPDRQLIYKASWKCLIYFLSALLVQYLDRITPLLMTHEGLQEATRHAMTEIVWPHFWLIQMWLVVLFFAYCALRELVCAIGREKVFKMFFGSPGDAG